MPQVIVTPEAPAALESLINSHGLSAAVARDGTIHTDTDSADGWVTGAAVVALHPNDRLRVL
jgi:hypothetical protein